jgi:hypothetical protein
LKDSPFKNSRPGITIISFRKDLRTASFMHRLPTMTIKVETLTDLYQTCNKQSHDAVCLHREMNKQNLILFGLDKAYESQENLMEKVVNLLKLLKVN